MSRSLLGSLAVAALGACTFTPSGGGDEPCVAACDGDDLISCPGGSAGAPVAETCPIACAATPTPHCGALAPSNVAATQLDPLLAEATGDLAVPSGTFEINTDSGAITPAIDLTGTRFALVEPSMAVLVVDSLTVPTGATLRGTGTRALIVVARGDIDVAGTIDFSAGCSLGGPPTLRCAGPGGGNGGSFNVVTQGCAPGGNGASRGGGAGGGMATLGGDGGPGATAATARPLANCGGDTLVPLHGGGGGGGGAEGSNAYGGGGGGAVQLSALGSARISGRVFVGGGGGRHGDGNNGGGGGGAGGGVLIEGDTVVLDGAVLIATGGGGGNGRGGGDGSSARVDGSVAAGGGGGGGGDGDGGDGATVSSPAGDGDRGGGGDSMDGGGGGGGGLGRIRVNVRGGGFTVPASANAAGAVSTGSYPVR